MRASGIAPLVRLVKCGTFGAQRKAADAIWCLSRDNDDSNLAIASAGGIAPLIALVERGTPETQQWSATRALKSLADGRPHVVDLDEYNDKDVIVDDAVRAGAIAALVGFARDGTSSAREVVAFALRNFGTNDEHRASIVREGAIASMVAHLREHGDGAEALVAVLWMCGSPSSPPANCCGANAMEIVREGGLPPLLAMAHAGAGDPDDEAAAAVSNLAADNAEFAAAVVAAGGGRFLCDERLAAHDAAGNADIGDEAEGDGSGGGGRDAPFVFQFCSAGRRGRNIRGRGRVVESRRPAHVYRGVFLFVRPGCPNWDLGSNSRGGVSTQKRCVGHLMTLNELRAGGWRGAESAEGAAPRSPPASSKWL